jgi:hypothetical protein
VLLVSASALAQPTEASKLFEEGRELAKQMKWPEACAKFQASIALDPAPGTKLNMGDCLEKQGKIRAGWLMFEEAARDFDRTNDSRAKFAHDRAASTQAKLATLVIKVAEPTREGLVVKIGDRTAAPAAEIVERVDPGSIQVTVTAPDKPKFSQTVSVSAGKTVVVDVPVTKDKESVVENLNTEPRHDQAEPEHVTVVEPSARRKRLYVAIALGGIGAASLITSGIVGLMARSQYNEAFGDGKCMKTSDGPVCPPEQLGDVDNAGTKADVATGFLVGGIALGAAAAVVYFTAPKERSVAVTPVATSSSVGATLQLRF